MSEIVNYCPECRSEYREGFSVCSDCDVALVRRLDSESPSGLVPLAREISFEFVAELLERLEQNEIPYVIHAGTALNAAESGDADSARPQPWEARVWVVAACEEAGTEVLEQLRQEWAVERERQVASRYGHLVD